MNLTVVTVVFIVCATLVIICKDADKKGKNGNEK